MRQSRSRFRSLAPAGLAAAALAVAWSVTSLAQVPAGVTAYETQKCATCHAIAGKGGKLATALDGIGTKMKEADIRKWLTTPAEMEAKLAKKPTMPMSTFLKTHKLTDADVGALMAYMLSLK